MSASETSQPPADPSDTAIKTVRGSGITFSTTAVIALFTIFGILLWKIRSFFHDDALISLRYARNLAEHSQLVWNLGEYAEGYTNLLHILLVTPLIMAGIGPMLAAQFINAAAFLGLVVIAWRLAQSFAMSMGAKVAAMCAVISAPVLTWVFGGLEPVLVAALVAGAYVLAFRVLQGDNSLPLSLAASGLFAAAYLARPDALIGNFAMGLALLAFANLPVRRRIVHFVAIGSMSALILCGHIVVRHAIYGELLPLTFYAKVGVSTGTRLMLGLEYLRESLPLLPTLFLLPVGALLLRSTDNLKAKRAFLAASLVALISLCYITWAGGDHMPNARFFVPLTPLLVIIAVSIMAMMTPMMHTATAVALIAASALTATMLERLHADNAAVFGAIMGKHLANTYPKPLTIAVATAGATPFVAAHHTFIDTLGLNDTHIAKHPVGPPLGFAQEIPGHAKGDAQYVLRRAPDIIVFGPATGFTAQTPVFRMDFELLDEPEFFECYQLVTHRIDTTPVLGLYNTTLETAGPWLHYYTRTCPKPL